ncbi:MAG: FAD:protein FMN transferase [Bifidobacteriaceae bacterium]|jgi:thiamine biosynthesis lipoprotein|nr:FAD:protein FMN transferase [Bifidobacteriaceae bacterium]
MASTISAMKRSAQRHGLGTTITLTVFGEQDDRALNAAFALIADYEDRLTVNRPVSEVMAVNDAAGKSSVVVSTSTYELISAAVAASRGNFGYDALIGPLVKLWKIGFTGARVPHDDEIAARMGEISPEAVDLDAATHAVKLTKPGMELDLGGIAKGYIADRIRDMWTAYGVAAGIVDLGGNLLFVGESPRRDDARWVIGVQDPVRSRHTDLGMAVLPSCSAVTSGIYERYLEIDGHKYHHLLDPRTGRPLDTDLAGVTVFTRDSIAGEIEAKRLFFAGGPIDGWTHAPAVFGAVFVYADGRVVSDGITLLKP